jgi:hypothetical protein
MPPRDLRVLNEAGTSVGGTSGRIMLTPQEAAIAEGIETPEEEVRFTHVSFACLRRAECYRCL